MTAIPSAHRPFVGALLGLLAALFVSTPAFADPAGPTDYKSTVVAVEPPAPTIRVEVIGGDSFVGLTVEEGTEVTVVGYQGEEYLWFRADGTVLENRNAPSTYTNEDRYGGAEIPPTADADAEPDWVAVASDGSWAWHDHRAHWMQSIRPPGLSEGDVILEAVIPLAVDGEEVDVTVISVWQPGASSVPVYLGYAVGVAMAVVAFLLRHGSGFGWTPVPLAVLALVVGGWQYASLPSETGPRPVWWLLPALAVVAAVVAAVAAARGARFVAWAATLVAGAELAIWGFQKSDGLSAALIPTDAPGWLDRFTVAAAISGGIGLALVALLELFDVSSRISGSREPQGSPHPAHR